MGMLDHKVAIVTGGASGIGMAAAELFRAEGATVVAADRTLGEGITQLDAGSEEEVEAFVERTVADLGGIDIVFANAGISGGMAGIFEQSSTDWQEILRVNLVGPFLLIKYAAPHMKERGGGSIICTASVAGLRAGAGGAAYSASKAGVISLVKVAATQLAGTNVRVNAICPGLIETGMTAPLYEWARSTGREERIGRLNPMKRGGEPGEIASVALFLASDAASYVNGQAIAVDGGLSASHPFSIQDYGRTSA
ncbi:SDR family oxidoreductase [Sphingomonas sp. RG327]|jgi:NAD(P)-dependent dehydrogenase (short-subunit alcohol dehydrogenase family)|uniref:SDR family oxidoreductase n=1 Tax=Sphingomonas anseongensis TaxID=2908207 RepID=A0ABT0RF26_9SPHN|nr:SDR family NAD(P)-dependent oxidoreductase [Sphingomonas anseongensis]MCL6678882.1 SDR family oxidoreductase [Sphingomonas anseongensis]